MVKASYLKRTKTGWYSYRRKVPERLRPYFPRTATRGEMAEWKVSFHTKDSITAQRLWCVENQKFDAAQRVAETMLQGQLGQVSGYEALRLAKSVAEVAGFHPDHAPKPPISTDDNDWERYKREMKEWEASLDLHRELLLEAQMDQLIDRDQQERDYKAGLWGKEGYATPYKPTKPNSVLSLAEKILEGDLRPALTPTWAEAVENYINVNKQERTRDPIKEKKWEVKTRGQLNRFGQAQGGVSVALSDLDRGKIRAWLQATYSNYGTRNRYVNNLSAVINTWNRENPSKPVANPFAGLANKQREQEQGTKIRSFTPDQFNSFLVSLGAHSNSEIRLIGLLMAYTGCRTSEAAGLTCRDVKLDDTIPHIVFRTNKIRRMDKKGLERAVPMVAPLITAFQRYNREALGDAPYFPRYGHTKGFDSVSAALRSTLTDKAGINEEGLVPYSFRHTMADKLRAARVRSDEAEYILGHVSKGSSVIHQRYGTTTPPRSLLVSLTMASEVTEWGYFEDS